MIPDFLFELLPRPSSLRCGRALVVRVIAAVMALPFLIFGQTGGLNIVSGVIDFSGAGHTLPAKVVATTGALPSSGCKAGELASVTSAPVGQQIYENSGNGSCIWTQQGGGASFAGCSADGSNGIQCTGGFEAGIGGGATGAVTMTGATSGNTVTMSVSPTTATGTITIPGVTGTTSYVASARTSGHCAEFDTDGIGLIDAGAACGNAAPGIVSLQTNSGAASEYDFTTTISNTYTDYMCRIIDVIPTNAAVDFQMQVSTNGGSSYDASSNYYTGIQYVPNSGPAGVVQTSPTTFTQVFPAIDNTTGNGGISGEFNIFNPKNASSRKSFTWQIVGNQSGAVYMGTGAGVWNSNTAVTAFRFKFSAGTIASGTVRCYGMQ